VNVTGGNDLSLPEYEEVLKIITANVDSDANIIAGYTVREEMQDQLKVTVIATGFNSARPAANTQAAEPQNGEIISYDEWVRMRKGYGAKTGGDFLVGRNAPAQDLNVPTVLRERKRMGQGDS
jgi:cell division protein FtsZ